MASIITKENGMMKEYRLSLDKDNFLSLNGRHNVILNGSKEQVIGLITHRYPRYFVLISPSPYCELIKINGEHLRNNIKLLRDGDELSINGKVSLFANGISTTRIHTVKISRFTKKKTKSWFMSSEYFVNEPKYL